MDEHETARPGLRSSLRRVGATILAIFQNRLELLVVELQEERIRLFNALLLLAGIVVMGALTLALGLSAAIVIVWDKFGVRGLWGLSGLGLVITLLAYWRLRVWLKNWPLLAGTLAELRKDRNSLEAKK